MTAPNNNFWFRPGRREKEGRKNPGILAVDDKYEFVAHSSNKEGTEYVYVCKFRQTVKIKCSARVRIIWNEDHWMLKELFHDHSCEPNRARVTAELLRHKMKNIVRGNPVQAVGKAVRTVRIEAAENYGHDEDFYLHLIAELGCDSALEKQLLRVRAEVIGQTPKSRNAFDGKEFLDRVYGKENNVIVCDSNLLEEGWREEIENNNLNSNCDWTKMDDNMRNMDEFHNNDDMDDDTGDSVDESDITEKDLPKRVLAFTSRKLLSQLSKHHKSSVDGTFKSSCSLWRQQFIWMIKRKGYWTPVVWGWLPDKTETSYKVFFLLIQKELQKVGQSLDVKSVLCDFELNIMKSVDVMLQCEILGCFFHLKNCFQRRVDRNGFKTQYERNENFRKFINECSALSHLPIDDVEEGLKHIDDKYHFEDDNTQKFKDEFIKYIEDFWIRGCLPPPVWNCFGRSEDLTNNNQEGYNSRINKELKETHPSPGVLLCHVRAQIILAEEKLVAIKTGLKNMLKELSIKS